MITLIPILFIIIVSPIYYSSKIEKENEGITKVAQKAVEFITVEQSLSMFDKKIHSKEKITFKVVLINNIYPSLDYNGKNQYN